MAEATRKYSFKTATGAAVEVTYKVTGEYCEAYERSVDGLATITEPAKVLWDYEAVITVKAAKVTLTAKGASNAGVPFRVVGSAAKAANGRSWGLAGLDVKGEKSTIWFDGLTDADIDAIKALIAEAKDEVISSDDQIASVERTTAAAKVEAEIAEAQRVIDTAAKHEPMTAAALKKWRRDYKNAHNEGGEGYIPERVSIEDVDRAKATLAKYGQSAEKEKVAMADYREIRRALAELEAAGQREPEGRAYNDALENIKALCAENLREYKAHMANFGTTRINEHIDAAKAYWQISYYDYSDGTGTRLYSRYDATLRIDYPDDGVAPPYVAAHIDLDPATDLVPLGARYAPAPYPCPSDGVLMPRMYVIR